MTERFEPAKWKGKRACVLGLGKSGLAAANLLAARGFDVLVSESRPAERLKAELDKLAKGARLELGGHGDQALACAFVVKSPGLPPAAPILRSFEAKGIPVFSELEVGLAFCPPATIFAVTGTNGKTTTTALLAAILSASGRRTHAAGNIGRPVCGLAAEVREGDVLAIEVSSYQLEDSRWFRADAACILNLTPDHLDHHGSLEAYRAAKAKVFERMTPAEACVFNADDPALEPLIAACPGEKLRFGLRPGPGLAAWIENGKILARRQGAVAALTPPRLPGEHNLQNAMAAALMALSRGVAPDAVQRAFSAFKGVEHRIEPAGEIRGVRFINDSKATNVDSTLVALKALAERGRTLWVILGGLDKGSPYAPLLPGLKAQAKGVLTIGSAAPKIESELKAVPLHPCGTLERAVDAALELAAPGDTVLLSPACASFDQFANFEERGRRFKELVKDHAKPAAR